MGIYSTETSFEGNSISRDLYEWLLENFPKGKTILELGSGWGSGQLIKHWNVWSVEDKEKWFQMYNPQSVLIPIDHNGWYNFDMMSEFMRHMRGDYDLLLIDGPYLNRKGVIQHYHMFDQDPRIPILFDDIKRQEGLEIMKALSARLERPYDIYWGGKFGVIK
jgi:hypothetical protein